MTRLYTIFFLLIFIGTSISTLIADNNTSLSTLTDDGAWCWFQDPRAVYVEGAHKRTYAGWVTRSGKLQLGAYDHETDKIEIVTLKENWGADDHNTCSFLVLPDKKLMVFYAQHNREGLFCRTTTASEDITSWDDEATVTEGPRTTYSHPVYLENEKRYYVFWRGESWKPTFSISSDGKSWSKPKILIQEEGRAALDIRPYIKIISDGKSSIHFAFTDGHPAKESMNSVYYLKYENGIFYRADGAISGYLDRLPIDPNKSDLVYDGKKTGVRSWVWDIALDRKGFPVIAYTRFPLTTDHRYHYMRWIGNFWLDTEIAPGGKWFPQTPAGEKETETYYSGGMALNASQPNIVYLSRQINENFEIEKWTTPDFGHTWTSKAITENSVTLNVRPVVPRYSPANLEHVLWMHGSYIHYKNYQTEIRMATWGK